MSPSTLDSVNASELGKFLLKIVKQFDAEAPLASLGANPNEQSALDKLSAQRIVELRAIVAEKAAAAAVAAAAAMAAAMAAATAAAAAVAAATAMAAAMAAAATAAAAAAAATATATVSTTTLLPVLTTAVREQPFFSLTNKVSDLCVKQRA